MGTIYENIYSYVGNSIYLDVLPQKASIPAIVYSVLSVEPIRTLEGTGDLTDYNIQFTCYGNTRKETVASGNTIKNKFRDYVGLMGTMRIQESIIEETDDLENIQGINVYKKIIDIKLSIGG